MNHESPGLIREIAEMKKMSLDDLRQRYREVFGEDPRIANKDHLWKRIAYRLQEIKHGGLSPEAQARLEELGRDAPKMCLRSRGQGKRGPAKADWSGFRHDPRIPPKGTVLTRRHSGIEHRVTVLERGFEYAGQTYRSLSAIAREITGTAWNGFGFFGLLGKGA